MVRSVDMVGPIVISVDSCGSVVPISVFSLKAVLQRICSCHRARCSCHKVYFYTTLLHNYSNRILFDNFTN